MADTATGVKGTAFNLRVISPERVLYDMPARSIVASGADGKLGVLRGHAPLVTALVPDVFRITDDEGKEQVLAVAEGFLEVVGDEVRVLVDSAERPDDIDVERAEHSRERAEKRLQSRDSADLDVHRAEASLRRAWARLSASKSA